MEYYKAQLQPILDELTKKGAYNTDIKIKVCTGDYKSHWININLDSIGVLHQFLHVIQNAKIDVITGKTSE